MTHGPSSKRTSKQTQKPASGVWLRQFEDIFDFPKTDIKTKFVLCTTPRCGSHFLGHMLHQTGDFGYPLEYMNPGNWQVWRQRAAEAGYQSPLDYIKSIRTGPNGVFGIKLHHEHLELFLQEEPDPLAYRFIHITRQDLLAQAISFAKAQQTNSWISDMEPTTQAHYDYAQTAAKMSDISQGNAYWTAFLASNGVSSLPITYEETAKAPQKSVEDIAEFLGVQLGTSDGVAEAFKPRVQKTKTDMGEDWAQRFIRETNDKLAKAESTPGVLKTPAFLAMKRDAKHVAKSVLNRLR